MYALLSLMLLFSFFIFFILLVSNVVVVVLGECSYKQETQVDKTIKAVAGLDTRY